ncbi:amino acid permease [Actinomyces provencensis]|uniref:amino acid permease n=1 Tax=Actinomyces provencensis TaxID=1720198 RepID=UPI00096A6ADF|nr:amino acid permease [Actinomyces provencensis]
MTGRGSQAEADARRGATATTGKRFKTRHLSMMALGSAIGAGFFLGTGVAVSEAGPAVLVSYVLAALLAISVMYALAELAAALPSTGSFSTYAEAGIGRWAGFTVGWLYWFTLIMVLGMEITGAAGIFVNWFPAVPQWTVALVIVVVLGGVNLLAAGDFGEVEAWLAGIKVFTIVAFLAIGIGLVTGIIPGRPESVVDNVLGHGGWAPHGLAGIAVGLLAIITSFGGIEIVTIAAAESEEPQRAMGQAIRSVIWRILVFYVGSVVLMICLLPWNSEEMRTNPFASVLDMAGIPAVGRIMEAVVFIALVSAFSANIYASSRMAYSLSARGMGARWLLGGAGVPTSVPGVPAEVSPGVRRADGTVGTLDDAPVDGTVDTLDDAPVDEDDVRSVVAHEGASGDLSRGRTPRRAVSVSIALALVSVGLNWWLPEALLGILLNAIGMSLLVVWLFVVVSQMRLHPILVRDGTLAIRMPGWPWLGWLVLAGLGAIGVLMAWSPSGRPQLIGVAVLTALIAGLYTVRQHWGLRRAARG